MGKSRSGMGDIVRTSSFLSNIYFVFVHMFLLILGYFSYHFWQRDLSKENKNINLSEKSVPPNEELGFCNYILNWFYKQKESSVKLLVDCWKDNIVKELKHSKEVICKDIEFTTNDDFPFQLLNAKHISSSKNELVMDIKISSNCLGLKNKKKRTYEIPYLELDGTCTLRVIKGTLSVCINLKGSTNCYTLKLKDTSVEKDYIILQILRDSFFNTLLKTTSLEITEQKTEIVEIIQTKVASHGKSPKNSFSEFNANLYQEKSATRKDNLEVSPSIAHKSVSQKNNFLPSQSDHKIIKPIEVNEKVNEVEIKEVAVKEDSLVDDIPIAFNQDKSINTKFNTTEAEPVVDSFKNIEDDKINKSNKQVNNETINKGDSLVVDDTPPINETEFTVVNVKNVEKINEDVLSNQTNIDEEPITLIDKENLSNVIEISTVKAAEENKSAKCSISSNASEEISSTAEIQPTISISVEETNNNEVKAAPKSTPDKVYDTSLGGLKLVKHLDLSVDETLKAEPEKSSFGLKPLAKSIWRHSFHNIPNKESSKGTRSRTGSETKSLRQSSSQVSLNATLGQKENKSSSLLIESATDNGRVIYYHIPPMLASSKSHTKQGQKIHVYNNHLFIATHFSDGLPKCSVCDNSLRGIGKQGYRCRDCGMVTHKNCHCLVEVMCDKSTLPLLQIEYVGSTNV